VAAEDIFSRSFNTCDWATNCGSFGPSPLRGAHRARRRSYKVGRFFLWVADFVYLLVWTNEGDLGVQGSGVDDPADKREVLRRSGQATFRIVGIRPATATTGRDAPGDTTPAMSENETDRSKPMRSEYGFSGEPHRSALAARHHEPMPSTADSKRGLWQPNS
jgi:hypothetical protein